MKRLASVAAAGALAAGMGLGLSGCTQPADCKLTDPILAFSGGKTHFKATETCRATPRAFSAHIYIEYRIPIIMQGFDVIEPVKYVGLADLPPAGKSEPWTVTRLCVIKSYERVRIAWRGVSSTGRKQLSWRFWYWPSKGGKWTRGC